MIAVVFPGQGSQKPGMGKSLVVAFPEAQAVFDEVSAATGVDVAKLCWDTDAEILRETQNAQLALFACSVAAWEVLKTSVNAKVAAVAGHSVGEYAALVASGVFPVDDAARLVRTRGELMAKAGVDHPGTMAAILGLARESVHQACESASGHVVVANDNSPGQLVISGEVGAVKRASEIALQLGAKRVLPLNVSGAFHSPLMEGPATEMRKALDSYSAAHPKLTVYANVTSEPAMDAFEWPSLLESQLVSPVRWTETIQHMVRDGCTGFVECGVGEVLGGLIKRIDPSVWCRSLQDPSSIDQLMGLFGS
jgi:[acyl-carrier-protein] S-malonyltransferase